MRAECAFEQSIEKFKSFGYPDEFNEVVSRFAICVNTLFCKYSPGVLLIGSTARGELSWAKKHDKIYLFSDVEFLIAISEKNKFLEKEFDRKVKRLELECNFGDLFHIDYTVIRRTKIPNLETKFFIFESKQLGIEFGIFPIRDLLPEVNRSNINWKELNEVLLHRLSAILHAIPKSYLNASMTENEKTTLALCLAKNTLDITTWLFPYEENELRAGFSQRLSVWTEKNYTNKKLFDYLHGEDIEYLNFCLKLRKSPFILADPFLMLEKTLLIYSHAISYCKAINNLNNNASLADLKLSYMLFDEYKFRQRAFQFIAMLKQISKFGFKKVLINTVNVKKGKSVIISHNLLLALNGYMKKDATCGMYLEDAKCIVSKLINVKKSRKSEFIDTWLKVRSDFQKYQAITRTY